MMMGRWGLSQRWAGTGGRACLPKACPQLREPGCSARFCNAQHSPRRLAHSPLASCSLPSKQAAGGFYSASSHASEDLPLGVSAEHAQWQAPPPSASPGGFSTALEPGGGGGSAAHEASPPPAPLSRSERYRQLCAELRQANAALAAIAPRLPGAGQGCGCSREAGRHSPHAGGLVCKRPALPCPTLAAAERCGFVPVHESDVMVQLAASEWLLCPDACLVSRRWGAQQRSHAAAVAPGFHPASMRRPAPLPRQATASPKSAWPWGPPTSSACWPATHRWR